jgi:predicted NAD/FAD-dependent oxidoreductase
VGPPLSPAARHAALRRRRYREIARFESIQLGERAFGRRLYFAGDYLMDPSWNGALLSGQRAARAVHADLSGRAPARGARS